MAEQEHFLRLEVVAPDGPVFEGDVAMVIIPAWNGEMGILPRHAPQVAQRFTGREGKYVAIADTVRGFTEILAGKHDDLPEQAFYMVGTIEEAIEKGKTLLAAV